MKLRSGTPLWLADNPPPLRAPTLTESISCDVAVLGGGVTGALCALRLAEAGTDTVVVDRRDLATGSTLACTGLLQYEIDTPLVDLIPQVGEAAAVGAYKLGRQAIDEIESLVGDLDDDCGFTRRESLYFASHFWHYRQLKREYECRLRHGFAVEWLERRDLAQLSSIRASGAIRSSGDAQIDPYRFTRAILRRATGLGLRIFAQTDVERIDEQAAHVDLHTPHGTIRARRIVYAAGYESGKYLDRSCGTLHSTYAVASAPLASTTGWPAGMLLWETARPYFYARQTADGRAIIGGKDSLFSTDHRRDALVARKSAALVRRCRRLFPELHFEPEFTWAGTFGESEDGMAYIGQLAGRPNAYFALGYGGNGITFSVIAADTIRDLWLGRPNPAAHIFRFDR